MSDEVCLACGNTGITATGEQCVCGVKQAIILPTFMEIPVQYQGVKFERTFLPEWLQGDYANYLEDIIKQLSKTITINKNILICAPPNSGKSIFAYNVYGMLYAKGVSMPKIRDLIEVRELFMAQYNVDINEVALYSHSKLAIIKIPMDVPNRFAETISTLIERRVRNNCTTIFLYSGSKQDLLAQDTFGKFKSIIGDGSYNSLEVKSWQFYSNKKEK